MSIVLNLFGAQGAGKSTAAAFLFSIFKQAGITAELASEFAKDKVWEENNMALSAQDYIFACQHYKLRMLKDKVDVIITDCPLPISLFYTKDDPTLGEPFANLVRRAFGCYDNINFFLYRVKPYVAVGQLQTEEESDEIALQLFQFLNQNHISFSMAPGSMEGFYMIAAQVIKLLEKRGVRHA